MRLTGVMKNRQARLGLVSGFLAPILLICALEASDAIASLREGDAVIVVVNATRVNLRATPSIQGNNIVGKAFGGAQFALEEEGDGWYKVRLPQGDVAWISGQYARQQEAQDRLEVISKSAEIRSADHSDSAIVERAAQGIFLEILTDKSDSGWYRVRLPSGKEGWVSGDSVRRHSLRQSSSVFSGERRIFLFAVSLGSGFSIFLLCLFMGTQAFRRR